MEELKPHCYGIYSQFSFDCGLRCRECKYLKECAQICFKQLKEMSGEFNVTKYIKKHMLIMKKIGIKTHKDIECKGRSSTKQLDDLSATLIEKELIKEGWVSNNLDDVQPFFGIVVGFIRSMGNTTAPKVVRAIQDRMTGADEKLAIGMAATSVQTLVKFKIIEVAGERIKWVAKE